ncbi:hypothetical protein MYAM1_001014 [Malassezia yamatoensis]|uniref:CP-type G domain-containing protein n=1 Tax=Malassezia yamatoensis TaxID=253288 RepID=A0AAJ5YXJ2_9BASI|nr:hypothetical protein MYAM1_001014 [Malassezia yamatoensis]
MPLPVSKNKVGLGHAILNRKAKEARDPNYSEYHTTDTSIGRGRNTQLQSVTHQGDLEDFLNTAEMADADFTAERRNNVQVIKTSDDSRTRHNPYLLTSQQEAKVLHSHQQNRDRLRVPRRPAWDANTTPAQLQRIEKDSFLEWRRGLAELQEGVGLVLTPFERNIEVWRQLWRVVERSNLLVQIVDARNPLRFRCEDLERYVSSIPANPVDMAAVANDPDFRGPRKTLLLINKADLLTENQRRQWAHYFEQQGIVFAYFSAADEAAKQLAKAQRDAQFAAAQEQEIENQQSSNSETDDSRDELRDQDPDTADADSLNAEQDDGATSNEAISRNQNESASNKEKSTEEISVDNLSLSERDPARILTVLELEDLFLQTAPDLALFARNTDGDQPSIPEKLTVGLVGYPNVGKSSTINALLGEKKVSVSSTPGKTKHFQTIHLSPTTILCDCPGLVFPQFTTTPADLVCDGILPIDQMREYTAPAELVAQRIPKDILEAVYNIHIPTAHEEEGGDGTPSGLEVLSAYAVARGFVRQGQGNPDESRAARYLLKDYNNARLLFAHSPPGVDPMEFNAESYDQIRKAYANRKVHAIPELASNPRARPVTTPISKTGSVDNAFFGIDPNAGMRTMGRRNAPFSARQAADSSAGEGLKGSSKKHHKANKRTKQRSGAGFA